MLSRIDVIRGNVAQPLVITPVVVAFDEASDGGAVQKILTIGDTVKITITGTVNGIMFQGDDYIKVKKVIK